MNTAMRTQTDAESLILSPRCRQGRRRSWRRKLQGELLEHRLVLSSATDIGPAPIEDLLSGFTVTRTSHLGAEPSTTDEQLSTVPFRVSTLDLEIEPPLSEGVSEAAPFGAAIGLNFQSATRSVSGYIPPDTMGAVGPDHVVTLINGRYRTFHKLDGAQLETRSLDQFWIDAGITPTNFSYDPRVVYDSEALRWYATALDNPQQNNRILFAVSATADPTDGWTGFAVDSDSSNGRWADFPALSLDDDGVYIGVNMFDIDGGAALSTERSTLVLPKSGLLANPPSIAGRTLLEDHISITGSSAQGVVYGNEGAGLPAVFVRGDSGNSMTLSQLLGPINAPSFADFTTASLSSANDPPLAEQPNDAGITLLDTGGRRVRSKVDFHNAAYWVVQGVQSPSTLNAAIRFVELSSTGSVNQDVIISHSTLDLFYPSIAVSGASGAENVLIGFTASGPNAGQFASAYSVIGKTTGGVTTFSAPFELAAGTATYESLDSDGRNRWGDYSATVVDPEDSNVFWTFQEYAIGATTWATQVSQIILTGTPSIESIFEPNQFGDAVITNGNLFDATDRDTWLFALDNPGPVTIQVTESGGLDPGLRLWNEETASLVEVDLDSGPDADDAQIDTSLFGFVRYSAEVFAEGTSGGDFTISLNGPNQTIDGTVALDANGDGADSTSLGSDDSDYFNLIAPLTADGSLEVTAVTSSATQNLVLNLYDAAGVQLARANTTGNGGSESINFVGVVPGQTYVLRIGETFYDDPATVDIEVNFGTYLPTTWTAVVEGYIPFHVSGVSNDVPNFDAFLDFQGDRDSYYIAGDRSGIYTIRVGDFGNAVNPVVAVYSAATGSVVAANDDMSVGIDDAEIEVVLNSWTRYILVVADAEGDTTGDVSITVTAPSATTPVTLNLNSSGNGSVSSFLDVNEDTDFFRFTAPSNVDGTLAVTVTPNTVTLNTVGVLFDSLGNRLQVASNGGAGAADTLVYNSVTPGTVYDLSVLSLSYATAGNFTVLIDFGVVLLGDFDHDSEYTCNDINMLVAEIASGGGNLMFDLNSDLLVNQDDLDVWLATAATFNGFASPYKRGDANLDGTVDGQDFIIWNSNKFTPIAAWCRGDFNADGFVDGQDFILWNTNKFTSSDTAYMSAVQRDRPASLGDWREMRKLPLSAVTEDAEAPVWVQDRHAPWTGVPRQANPVSTYRSHVPTVTDARQASDEQVALEIVNDAVFADLGR